MDVPPATEGLADSLRPLPWAAIASIGLAAGAAWSARRPPSSVLQRETEMPLAMPLTPAVFLTPDEQVMKDAQMRSEVAAPFRTFRKCRGARARRDALEDSLGGQSWTLESESQFHAQIAASWPYSTISALGLKCSFDLHSSDIAILNALSLPPDSSGARPAQQRASRRCLRSRWCWAQRWEHRTRSPFPMSDRAHLASSNTIEGFRVFYLS